MTRIPRQATRAQAESRETRPLSEWRELAAEVVARIAQQPRRVN